MADATSEARRSSLLSRLIFELDPGSQCVATCNMTVERLGRDVATTLHLDETFVSDR